MQLTPDQAKRAAQALMRASEAKDRRAQEQLDMRSSDKGAGWNAQRCETADHYRKDAFADRLLANELYAAMREPVVDKTVTMADIRKLRDNLEACQILFAPDQTLLHACNVALGAAQPGDGPSEFECIARCHAALVGAREAEVRRVRADCQPGHYAVSPESGEVY
jgi:hypothetical protein